jgi:hypothetical protein
MAPRRSLSAHPEVIPMVGTACSPIDDDYGVYGIGALLLTDSIGKGEIAIYMQSGSTN